MTKQEKKNQEKLLENKIAIVTGAAMGIGRVIATEMAKEGAMVVIADVDESESRKTEQLIRKLGNGAIVVPTDVSDKSQNGKLVAAVLEKFGRVDILVNNAGINTPGGLLECTEEGAMDVFKTNLTGPFFLTQRVAQEMVKAKIKGNILFVSSVHSHITQLQPAYSATKAALEMLVREFALELAEHGIRVNAVAPGPIYNREPYLRTENPHVPLGFSGIPQDIASAMIFLASDKACFITGQTLVVDGGFSLTHTRYWLKKGVL